MFDDLSMQLILAWWYYKMLILIYVLLIYYVDQFISNIIKYVNI